MKWYIVVFLVLSFKQWCIDFKFFFHHEMLIYNFIMNLFNLTFAGKSNNVGSLFQSAGEIGKELETLVTVMTDDSAEDDVKH